jgi:hypothetical protein
MKHIFSSLLTSGFIATLAFSPAAFSQTTTHTPPTPAQIAQRRVQALTNFLSLNSTQQGEALTIFTTLANNNVSIEANLKTARQTLDAAVESNNTASIATAAGTIGSLTTQLTTNNATADAQFYLILNTEQQTKFAKMLTRGGVGPMGGAFGRGRPQ